MPVVKAKEFEYVFGLNKQAAIGTSIATAKLTKKLPFRGFAPNFVEPQAIISDRSWYGKGHSFPTFYDQMTKLVRIPARDYSLTQLSALMAAFVLGDVTSTRPNSASAPTVWDHVMRFQDPETNPDALYTSMIEKAGGEYQKRIIGAVLNSFSLNATRTDHVIFSTEGFARWMEDDATDLDAVALASNQTFFKLLKASINFGASGGAVDVSDEVLSFNLTVNQNADLTTAFLPGAPEGEEGYMGRVLIGDQTVSGQLVMFLDAARRNRFINQNECELTIVLTGDTITGAFKHTVTIVIPHFKIAAETFGEEGQTTAYTMNINEDSVLKVEGEDFFRYTVRTNIDNTDLLVSSS